LFKNRNFGEKKTKFWSKHKNFGENTKCWSKPKILVKNRNFGEKKQNFGQKIKILVKTQNVGQNSKFW